ncbi:MAG TPA: sulfatase-like hydrolase/transferase [Mycobacteriales bacterium]|nr:sulfatase-like hydrolase/transferase [Mycobacteriales bacterium]
MTPPGRSGARRLAELLALTAFAIAQPLLDVTGRSPDLFLYRRATPADLAALLLLVALGPPLLLWGVEQAAWRLGGRVQRGLHHAFTGGLLAVVAVQAGKDLHLATGAVLAAAAVAAGAALAVLAARSRTFRQVLVVATPAPLVFALLFVATTPAGALLRPAAHGASGRAVAAKRPPVVFVFLDEFPLRALLDEHGQVDGRLFPGFARLARETTWYPDATGVSGWTPYAAPAMLTGRYPRRAVAPSYTEYPDNLFTLLAPSYDVHAYESVAQLCPPSVCSGTPAGRATGLAPLLRDTAGVARELVSPYPAREEIGGAYEERSEPPAGASPGFRMGEAKESQPERFTAFLDGLRASDRPTLSFLHLLLPHGPWRYLPSGRRYDTIPLAHVLPPQPEGPSRLLANDPVLAALARQRLLLQLAYTDGLVDALLDRMHASSLFDDALLVVTADHGEGLAPGAHWRSLEDATASDLAWVPLFVKTPGQRHGRVDPRNEQHVDLLPTIADVLDLDVPWPVDGVSLLGPPRTGDRKYWYDVPGERREIDAARFRPATRHGIAPRVVTPALGQRGLFVPKAVRSLVGRRVGAAGSPAVGPPAAVRATLADGIDLAHVRLGAESVPAMVRGDLDRAPAGGSTWFAIAVDGTFAGGAAVVPGPRDGKWRFMGLVDDRYLHDGAVDVVLYAVDGGTVRPIPWQE